jgi:hypothetical protein
MEGIPPAVDTDAEDVAWALQTADALWKRNERIDAIVWLRRAAQAAGETEDDDRALALARNAAELSDWIAQNFGGHEQHPSSPVGSTSQNPAGVDDLLSEPISDIPKAARIVVPVVHLDRPSTQSIDIDMSVPEPAPSAAEVHAGILNPWAAADDEGFIDAVTAVKPKPHWASAAPAPVISSRPPVIDDDDEEQVVTSARGLGAITGENRALSRPPVSVAEPAPPPSIEPVTASMMNPREPTAPQPPPLPAPRPPPRRVPVPKGAELDSEHMAAAPRVPSSPPLPARVPPPFLPPAVETKPGPPVIRSAPGLLDLSAVEAFADLPDDAREDFARAATQQSVERGEEISGFALAFLIEGSADVAATIVDAVAERIEAGTVLRSRGSVADSFPIRLVAASPTALIATWDDASVAAAFNSCPWVEEDLRAAADRMQALVGITMGPLAARLDPSLRHDLMARLKVRFLSGGEVLVEQGKAVPGLLLVGVGSLELVVGEDVRGRVGAGEFIFADAILGGGVAPMTARAPSEGAVILHADRNVAQELLVTCPPLLEIFAGM